MFKEWNANFVAEKLTKKNSYKKEYQHSIKYLYESKLFWEIRKSNDEY